ncbi:MAG: hypothetical protein Tsb0034_29000 [Ekhidna sp.]
MKMEQNDRVLKDSIKGLRQAEAPNIWSSIAAGLDDQNEQNREVLGRSIEALPQHDAPDVWAGVAREMGAKREGVWKYLAIAASISLVAVVSFLFLSNPPSERVSYSTEQVDFFDVNQSLPSITSDADDMLLTYIKENCTRLATTCQDPEFKELLEAYMELDETKKELNQALKKTTDQAQVMKYLIKVEKSQTELGKDMLKKMRSI